MKETESIAGIKIVAGVKRINHSQFLDDIFFLGGASSIIERRFKMVLDHLFFCLRWAYKLS
jgi:hypothetical protein